MKPRRADETDRTGERGRIVTFATPSGIGMLCWLLTAYDIRAQLTKAQRLALDTGQGSTVVTKRLEARDLWRDGKPTLWGEFVRDCRTDGGLRGFAVDREGNLYRIRSVE